MTGKISEIFFSVQGEGKFVGDEQCFVRFYGCNLKCEYCDTKPDTFQEYSSDELFKKIKEVIGEAKIKTVSITGGEPLLQSCFLLDFLPKLKTEGFNIYLETNGVLHEELFDVAHYVDIIAMDIKLPSSTKERPFWSEHEEFLKIAKDKDCFVKLIICLDTALEDFKKAAALISKIAPQMTFILQPNSFQLGRDLADKLQEFKRYTKDYFFDVRIIPQVHKLMGVK